MQANEMTTMYVNFAHMQEWDAALAESVAEEFYRFEPYLRRGLVALVRQLEPEFLMDEGDPREFTVAFFNTGDVRRVRDLTMKSVGALATFCGTVTRTSEVRPELLVGRFICGECGSPSAPVEQQFKMTEPVSCANASCTNRSKWQLDTARSRFGDWQRVRAQENADEIPPGAW
jgi:DNA replication licensing factor MCM6